MENFRSDIDFGFKRKWRFVFILFTGIINKGDASKDTYNLCYWNLIWIINLKCKWRIWVFFFFFFLKLWNNIDPLLLFGERKDCKRFTLKWWKRKIEDKRKGWMQKKEAFQNLFFFKKTFFFFSNQPKRKKDAQLTSSRCFYEHII